MSLSGKERPHIWTVGATTESPMTPTIRTRIRAMAQQLLADAVDPALVDDRFEGNFGQGETFRAALALAGDSCLGLLGGSINRGRLQLSGLVVPPNGPLALGGQSKTGRAQPPLESADPDGVSELLQDLFDALTDGFGNPEIEVIELWSHPTTPWFEALAAANGFEPLRALHQLRCQLPVSHDPGSREPQRSVATRPFEPSTDAAALIEVNNRAFLDHPDQGEMTTEDLHQAMAQPWFDANGLRVLDDPDLPSTLAGFCWTKIHPASGSQPELGEIYAIGIDPRHHGQGLGGPMTASGLEWLAGHGITTGMLYVEASNERALKTYRRLGFVSHRTDRAWVRPASGTGSM